MSFKEISIIVSNPRIMPRPDLHTRGLNAMHLLDRAACLAQALQLLASSEASLGLSMATNTPTMFESSTRISRMRRRCTIIP